MLSSILDFFEKLKLENQIQPGLDITNIIAVIVAASAFVVAFREYNSNRRKEDQARKDQEQRYQEELTISREEHAKELYRDYLKVCMEHPNLSAAEYNANDKTEIDRYDTFLSIMLSAFDDCVNYIEGSFYDDIIDRQVRVHDSYIRGILHKDLIGKENSRGAYSQKFLKIVDETFDRIDREELARVETLRS